MDADLDVNLTLGEVEALREVLRQAEARLATIERDWRRGLFDAYEGTDLVISAVIETRSQLYLGIKPFLACLDARAATAAES